MAEIFKNDKEFLILKTSAIEIIDYCDGYGICDSCNAIPKDGYYVAVLNYWICPTCFEEWIKTAKRYSEDIPYEKRHFDRICKFFSINQ